MKNRIDNDNSTDFLEFLQATATPVSKDMKDQLWSRIYNEIHPNVWMIFLKVLGIHLVVGFISLSICHQFHMNPFHTHTSLADWFIEVGGDKFCMAASGMLFIGLSMAAAGFLLSSEELSSLKKTKYQQVFVLSLISLGLFAAGGAELAIGMSVVWMFGALLGGFLMTETVWKIKYSSEGISEI